LLVVLLEPFLALPEDAPVPAALRAEAAEEAAPAPAEAEADAAEAEAEEAATPEIEDEKKD